MDEKEVGASPGSLVYTGDMKHPVGGRLFRYDHDGLEEETFEGSLPPLIGATGTQSWLIINGVHDVDMVKAVGARFGVHALVLEDLVNPTQRMKLEEYDDYLFIVLKWLVTGEKETWETEQLGIILLEDWCILFMEEDSDFLEPVLRRLRKKKSTLRHSGTDYLVYALIDLVVDHYMKTANELSERTDELEDQLMEANDASLDTLKILQKHVQTLKRNLRAMKELHHAIGRAEPTVIHENTRLYFRDVQDHTLQCLDQVENLQESINSALNFYHSMISLRLNEIMKFLTMMGSIFIPLTFIAGIYGMNFQEMPELKWTYGYPAALCLMAALSIGILLYFRHKKWL